MSVSKAEATNYSTDRLRAALPAPTPGVITYAPKDPAGPMVPEVSPYQLAILGGLQRKRRGEVYEGTVPAVTVARRRRANKAAGRARAMHRRRAR